MCDDHRALGAAPRPSRLTRRGFLHGSAALGAAAAVGHRLPRELLRPAAAARPVTADGTSAYSMAMHIHSSFSEQSGSMDSQLFQAAKNAVDVLWWTDHDARMDGIGYRDTVHFTSLTAETGGPGQGGAWIWQARHSGQLTSGSGGGIVTTPSSPNDPVSGGSLQLTAQSTSSAVAKYGFYANCHPAGWNYRDNLTGQSLSVDVMLAGGWSTGYLEMLISTSYHQASGGRPAGAYSLSYRFVPAGKQAHRSASGLKGVITIPVKPTGGNPWYTATVSPSDDIAALWPDLDQRDFALFGLTMSAVSTGQKVAGYFDYLQFDRTVSGEAFLEQQAEMSAVLASQYPNVVQQQGLEVSWLLPHLSWFGGNVVMPSYGDTKPRGYAGYLSGTLVPQTHRAGGLVSYNHPFGFNNGPLLSASQQNALVRQVATNLLPTKTVPGALGCDLLEVGYELRGGCDVTHHEALWDAMSRNAVFLTGNGASDDHFGTNWYGIENNWVTSVWAASTGQSSLLAALAAGRAWSGSLSDYQGSLDLLADGSAPMGSVSVSTVGTRQLTVSASGIPGGGSVQVLQGDVDYAGTSDPTGNSQVIATYSPSQLSGGSVTLPVDNSTSSYLRTQVVDGSGTTIALSNPIWLLRAAPPGGIPAPRAA